MSKEILKGIFEENIAPVREDITFEGWVDKIKDNEEYKVGLFENYVQPSMPDATFEDFNAETFGLGKVEAPLGGAQSEGSVSPTESVSSEFEVGPPGVEPKGAPVAEAAALVGEVGSEGEPTIVGQKLDDYTIVEEDDRNFFERLFGEERYRRVTERAVETVPALTRLFGKAAAKGVQEEVNDLGRAMEADPEFVIKASQSGLFTTNNLATYLSQEAAGDKKGAEEINMFLEKGAVGKTAQFERFKTLYAPIEKERNEAIQKELLSNKDYVALRGKIDAEFNRQRVGVDEKYDFKALMGEEFKVGEKELLDKYESATLALPMQLETKASELKFEYQTKVNSGQMGVNEANAGLRRDLDAYGAELQKQSDKALGEYNSGVTALAEKIQKGVKDKPEFKAYMDELNELRNGVVEGFSDDYQKIQQSVFSNIAPKYSSKIESAITNSMKGETPLLDKSGVKGDIAKIVGNRGWDYLAFDQKRAALDTMFGTALSKLKRSGVEINDGVVANLRAEFDDAFMDRAYFTKKGTPSLFMVKTRAIEEVERLDEMIKERKRLMISQGASEEQNQKNAVARGYGEYDLTSANMLGDQTDIRELYLAREKLQEIIDMPETMSDSEWSNFWNGLTSGRFIDYLPFVSGLKNLSGTLALYRAVGKDTESARYLKNAEALNSTYQSMYEVNNMASDWYKAGKGTAQSLPFMMEFAATAGVGSGVRLGTEKVVVKLLGTRAKTVVGKSLKVMAGTLISSLAQTTLNPQRYVDETLKRMTPQMTMAFSPEGDDLVAMLDSSDVEGGFEAALKGFGVTASEYFSEGLGFAGARAMKAVGSKMLQNEFLKRAYVGWYMSKFNFDMPTAFKKIAEMGGWNGFLMEFGVEELTNIPLTNLITGDAKVMEGIIKDGELDTENLADIARTLLPISLAGGAVSLSSLAISKIAPEGVTITYRDINNLPATETINKGVWDAVTEVMKSPAKVRAFIANELPKLKVEGKGRQIVTSMLERAAIEFDRGVVGAGTRQIAEATSPLEVTFEPIDDSEKAPKVEIIAKRRQKLNRDRTKLVPTGGFDYFAKVGDKEVKLSDAEYKAYKESGVLPERVSAVEATPKVEGEAVTPEAVAPEVPALKDVESTAKALEGGDIISKVTEKIKYIFYTGRGEKYKDLNKTKGDFIFFSKDKTKSEWYGGDKSRVSEAFIDDSEYIDLTSQEKKSEFVDKNFTDEDITNLYPDLKTKAFDDRDVRKTYEQKLKELIDKKREQLKENRFSGDNKEQKFLLTKAKQLGIKGIKLLDTFFGQEDISTIAIDKSTIKTITPNTVSEAYHKAKEDGSNPELVSAVEELLGKPTQTPEVAEGQPAEVISPEVAEVLSTEDTTRLALESLEVLPEGIASAEEGARIYHEAIGKEERTEAEDAVVMAVEDAVIGGAVVPEVAPEVEGGVVKGFYTPSKNAQASRLQSSGLPVGKFIALDAPFVSEVHSIEDAQQVEVDLSGKKIYNPNGLNGFPKTEDLSRELGVYANEKIKEGGKTFEEIMTEFYRSKGYDGVVRLIDGGMRNNERELIVFDRDIELKQSTQTPETAEAPKAAEAVTPEEVSTEGVTPEVPGVVEAAEGQPSAEGLTSKEKAEQANKRAEEIAKEIRKNLGGRGGITGITPFSRAKRLAEVDRATLKLIKDYIYQKVLAGAYTFKDFVKDMKENSKRLFGVQINVADSDKSIFHSARSRFEINDAFAQEILDLKLDFIFAIASIPGRMNMNFQEFISSNSALVNGFVNRAESIYGVDDQAMMLVQEVYQDALRAAANRAESYNTLEDVKKFHETKEELLALERDMERARINEEIKRRRNWLSRNFDKFKRAFITPVKNFNRAFEYRGGKLSDYRTSQERDVYSARKYRMGASTKANNWYNAIHNKIYGGLSWFEKVELDKYLIYRRIVEVAEIRNQRAAEHKKLENELAAGVDPVRKQEIKEAMAELEKAGMGEVKSGSIMVDGKNEPYTVALAEAFVNDINARYDVLALKIRSRAEMYTEANNELLKMRLDAGEISQEAYDSMEKRDYVRRLFVDLSNTTVDEANYSPVSKEIKAIKEGREDAILEMDSQALLQISAQITFDSVAKNNFIKKVVGWAETKQQQYLDKALEKFKDAHARKDRYLRSSPRPLTQDEIDRFIKEQTLFIPLSDDAKVPSGFTAQKYFVDGVEKRVAVRNDIANVFQTPSGRGIKENSFAIKLISAILLTPVVKASAVFVNPAFAIGNFALDVIHASMVTRDLYKSFTFNLGTILAKATGYTAENVYRKAVKFGASLFGRTARDSKFERLVKDYFEHGGGMSGLANPSSRMYSDKLSSSALRRGFGDAKDGIIAVLDVINSLQAGSELITRVIVYEAALDKNIAAYREKNGVDPVGDDLALMKMSAAASAADLIDFREGAEATKAFDQTLFPFLNAMIQGAKAEVDFVSKNPLLAAGRLAEFGGMALGVALYNANSGDEDEKENVIGYNGISEYIKSNYFIMMMPWTKKNERGEIVRPFLSIKLPAALKATNILVSGMVADQGADNTIGQMVSALEGGYVPEIGAVSPTAQIYMALRTNEDAFRKGAPIYRGRADVLLTERFNAGETKAIYRDLFGAMYDLINEDGENEGVLGFDEAGPAQWQAAFEKAISPNNPYYLGITSTYAAISSLYGKENKREVDVLMDEKFAALNAFRSRVYREPNSSVQQKNIEDRKKIDFLRDQKGSWQKKNDDAIEFAAKTIRDFKQLEPSKRRFMIDKFFDRDVFNYISDEQMIKGIKAQGIKDIPENIDDIQDFIKDEESRLSLRLLEEFKPNFVFKHPALKSYAQGKDSYLGLNAEMINKIAKEYDGARDGINYLIALKFVSGDDFDSIVEQIRPNGKELLTVENITNSAEAYKYKKVYYRDSNRSSKEVSSESALNNLMLLKYLLENE